MTDLALATDQELVIVRESAIDLVVAIALIGLALEIDHGIVQVLDDPIDRGLVIALAIVRIGRVAIDLVTDRA